MGDMGDYWGDVRTGMAADSIAKRAGNRYSSAKWLAEVGVKMTTKNNGQHLMIDAPDGTRVNFWPGTGMCHCKCGYKTRGVRNVIRHLRKHGLVERTKGAV